MISRNEQIFADWKADLPLPVIARKHGVSPHSIITIARRQCKKDNAAIYNLCISLTIELYKNINRPFRGKPDASLVRWLCGDRRVEDIQFSLKPLTSTEKKVLTLLEKGLSTIQVAAEIGASPRTVDNHRQTILRKTDFKCIHDATVILFLKKKFNPKDK